MHDSITTIGLAALTLLSLATTIIAVRSLFVPAMRQAWQARINWLTVAIGAGCAVLYLHRLLLVNHHFAPLEAHVDGLLLIGGILAAMIPLIARWSTLPGLFAFALPLLTLFVAWGVCASAWTFHPFDIDSTVQMLHRMGVYLGTLCFVVAASAGAMFLYVDRRLRHKADPPGRNTLGSLEAIERLIIRASGLGFGLLTFGIIMGIITTTSEPTSLGVGWWYSPKVLLAFGAWLIYAVVMNVRHATVFRGTRAAWLSIAGLVLMLAVSGIAVAMPGGATAPDTTTREVTP
jgi:ABC-type uncharacterized transport system permease subunit